MDNQQSQVPTIPTRGAVLYNRGRSCLTRLIISLESIRQWYNGDITLFLEGDHDPKLVEDLRREFNVHITVDNNPDTGVYVRAVELCCKTPYDSTIWLDSDILVFGKIDELFDEVQDYDLVIPHFARWNSNGPMISGRIRDYQTIVPPDWIEAAINYGPCINCGVYAFRKNSPFLKEWNSLAKKGEQIKRWDEKKKRWNTGMFIPDEKACQVLLPKFRVKIVDPKYNVSVIHDNNLTTDIRIIHFHGRKHTFDVPFAHLWQEAFYSAVKRNLCDIGRYTTRENRDKRLTAWLHGEMGNLPLAKKCVDVLAEQGFVDDDTVSDLNARINGVTTVAAPSPAADAQNTVVTACDPIYVDLLRLTFPNWRKYKGIDRWPVIVFVNGMAFDDPRLDFLRLPNVTLASWERGVNGAPDTDNHRELMLSAFVLGSAQVVKTPYWLKMDADSFATDSRDLLDGLKPPVSFVGHRWGYSWEKHIKALDDWAAAHPDDRLRAHNGGMYSRGAVSGRRFYHTSYKRTISFIQWHSTEFTQLCARLAGSRLPAPSHDTYMLYVADRLGIPWETANFKKHRGFDQGKGVDALRIRLAEVDAANGSPTVNAQEIAMVGE